MWAVLGDKQSGAVQGPKAKQTEDDIVQEVCFLDSTARPKLLAFVVHRTLRLKALPAPLVLIEDCLPLTMSRFV
jgi:hypothetical protein